MQFFLSPSSWWVLPFHPSRVKGQDYLEVPVTTEGRKKLSLPPPLLPSGQTFMHAVSLCLQRPSLPSLSESSYSSSRFQLKHHLLQEVLHAFEGVPRA